MLKVLAKLKNVSHSFLLVFLLNLTANRFGESPSSKLRDLSSLDQFVNAVLHRVYIAMKITVHIKLLGAHFSPFRSDLTSVGSLTCQICYFAN